MLAPFFVEAAGRGGLSCSTTAPGPTRAAGVVNDGPAKSTYSSNEAELFLKQERHQLEAHSLRRDAGRIINHLV